jgi:hypothetical protein
MGRLWVASLNWAGQRYWLGPLGIHPEWIAAGTVLLLIASAAALEVGEPAVIAKLLFLPFVAPRVDVR